MRTQKAITPLPFGYYCWPVIFLAIAGLADSIYLAVSHYRNYVDIGYSSFCAISKAINCDTVSQSSFSIFLGVPVPVWGVLGYALFFALAFFAWRQRKDGMQGWNALFFLALIFTLYSLVLAFISSYLIRSYCIMCIVSYGINLLLLFSTWIIKRRFDLPGLWIGMRRDFLHLWHAPGWRIGILVVSAVTVAGVIFYPDYWNYAAELPKTSLSTGYTEDGHPWIGAASPELEITEYTDYLCFQCRKMHYFLRMLIARYPDKIRLIHRHFPMDHEVNPMVKEPFHEGAGKLAVLALYAAEQGKFWEMNDQLFAMAANGKSIDLQELADRVGLKKTELVRALTDRIDLRNELMKDIQAGLALRIPGTPAYVIGDMVYLGKLPPEILEKFID